MTGRRAVRITRDWVITCVALALLVWEAIGEARPAVLIIFAGLAASPHAVRLDRGERKEVERDGAD